MPGPAPKPPDLRQRRNKVSTAATLEPVDAATVKIPKLPRTRNWHPLTKAFWRDVWKSPMRAEFVEADIHGLYVLVELVDRFWEEPNVKLAAEIRQQRQNYGLTPLDRRRLQWEVGRVESAAKKKQAPAKKDETGFDPRELIRVTN